MPPDSGAHHVLGTALDELLHSRDARKVEGLQDAAQECLRVLGTPDVGTLQFTVLFDPLRLAVDSRLPSLMTIAVDALGKLFSHGFWAQMIDLESVMRPRSSIDEDDDDVPVKMTGDSIELVPLPPITAPDSVSNEPTLAPEDKSLSGVTDRDEQEDEYDAAASVINGPITGAPGTYRNIARIIVDKICQAFHLGEETDVQLQLQIIKSLHAAVAVDSPRPILHSTLLLKAIRTTYTVFLHSKNTNVQVAAQATVNQMVQLVFGRVQKLDLSGSKVSFAAPMNSWGPSVEGDSTVAEDPGEGIQKEKDAVVLTAAQQTKRIALVRSSTEILGPTDLSTLHPSSSGEGTLNDKFIKDAFLVFRALSKLSMKPIPNPESSTDIKSQAMRSKLLALHLIHSLLITHLPVFLSAAPVLFSSHRDGDLELMHFIHAVKQYLFLSLSRNTVSVVPQVFDVAVDIFGRVLASLRHLLKKELAVLLTEIIVPILEAKGSITFHQRSSLVRSLLKLYSDPKLNGGQILVEIYLNYDCDVNASVRENVWERTVTALSKLVTQHVGEKQGSREKMSTLLASTTSSDDLVLPQITTANLGNMSRDQIRDLMSSNGDFVELKKRSLELLVNGILQPLIEWAEQRSRIQESIMSPSLDNGSVDFELASHAGTAFIENDMLNVAPTEDDPSAFESIKQKKKLLWKGVQKFNTNSKKGMSFLHESGVLGKKGDDIAKFLFSQNGLNKSALGEYLGQGEQEFIDIMHKFVDMFKFEGLAFVDALRTFLQSFRLPGEAQKIDRFMLKFADRYVKSNPNKFESADTAYVLAYSVIMLNTDLHNQQVKTKMTKEDFIKNNRGIDNGNDIPKDYLEQIYNEINGNEIVMKDERLRAAETESKKDAVMQFAMTSENMAQKTEALLNTLMGAKGDQGQFESGAPNSDSGISSNFYAATHYEHIKPMMELVWLGVLAGVSGPLQDSDDPEVVNLALEGFKYAVRISSMFGMDLEMKAYISTLSKWTQLSNLTESKAQKNLAAVRVFLEIANTEGNNLHEIWRQVVKCVSQLEKLQVLAREDQDKGSFQQRSSVDSKAANKSRTPRTSAFMEEIASQAGSQSMTIAADRIFTSSKNLSGQAIVEFVRYLCEVSLEEIQASSDREHPRMYCLQRLIEISFYNMRRIRVEWVNIWNLLGEHFNQVACHSNANAGFFALDKLRQLSYNFLDLEELPNFKFQKEFLRPFEEAMSKNPDLKIKDMVLACIQQLLQAKSARLKSGWKTIFSTLIKAAKEKYEPIVLLSFDIVKSIYKNNFTHVVVNGSFPDFVACLVEFCKNPKFTKISLHSIELFKQAINRTQEVLQDTSGIPANFGAAKASENLTEMMHQGLISLQSIQATNQQKTTDDDPNIRFWFPTFFGLYEVIMVCDLEVRTRALNYLFDTLKLHGKAFSKDFWEVIAKGTLYPIFDDLRLSRKEHTSLASKEDMSVWLSTTLIQALRQLIDLQTFYFEELAFLLDDVLDILVVCITQENESLSRLGSTCFQQLIESNYEKMDEHLWRKISNTLIHLLKSTIPEALFFDPYETPQQADVVAEPRMRNGRRLAPKPEMKDFQRIIVKCVLHHLIILTVQEILACAKGKVIQSMKTEFVLELADSVYESYQFASDFNADKELRQALFELKFMKQPPNLLKQELTSISTYTWVLGRIFADDSPARLANRDGIQSRLIPACNTIFQKFAGIDSDRQEKEAAGWSPVVLTTMEAILNFPERDFKAQIPSFYKSLVDLVLQDSAPQMKMVLHAILIRTGDLLDISSAAEG